MKTKPASMLWELIGRLADTCLTFRISGEPGVGKEAIAHLIRRHYPHKESAFTKISCKDKMGPSDTELKTALASPKNRVFLFEEIQCLSDEIQQQIAELITQTHPTAAPWIFSASEKPLEHFQGKTLNSNLFKALDTIHIAVPPLRAHPDKIPQILSWYLNAYSKSISNNLPALPDAKMMDQLLGYTWPGNLRQLQHTAWRAFETSDWDAAIADLDAERGGNDHIDVDEIAAIYLMSLAKLSIQREKIIEGLMTASHAGEIGLLDLAIYNEAVSQITNHIATCETETSQDK